VSWLASEAFDEEQFHCESLLELVHLRSCYWLPSSKTSFTLFWRVYSTEHAREIVVFLSGLTQAKYCQMRTPFCLWQFDLELLRPFQDS
jgi:hypothetical protein